MDGLNGATNALVEFIAKNSRVEIPEARNMLEANLKAFGPKVILEAHATTVAAMTAGTIPHPYKYMIGAARNMKSEQEKRGAKKPFKPSRFAL